MHGEIVLKPKIFHQFSTDKLKQKIIFSDVLSTFLDLGFTRNKTRNLYRYKSNVSLDPVVVVKALSPGYLKISSFRKLMRQIEDRISFRWFLDHDIDEVSLVIPKSSMPINDPDGVS